MLQSKSPLKIKSKLFQGLSEDGVIDSSDAVFNQLKVWRDLNQDEISDLGSDVNKPNELFALSELGITAINLDGLNNVNRVQDNNFTRQFHAECDDYDFSRNN